MEYPSTSYAQIPASCRYLLPYLFALPFLFFFGLVYSFFLFAFHPYLFTFDTAVS